MKKHIFLLILGLTIINHTALFGTDTIIASPSPIRATSGTEATPKPDIQNEAQTPIEPQTPVAQLQELYVCQQPQPKRLDQKFSLLPTSDSEPRRKTPRIIETRKNLITAVMENISFFQHYDYSLEAQLPLLQFLAEIIATDNNEKLQILEKKWATNLQKYNPEATKKSYGDYSEFVDHRQRELARLLLSALTAQPPLTEDELNRIVNDLLKIRECVDLVELSKHEVAAVGYLDKLNRLPPLQ